MQKRSHRLLASTLLRRHQGFEAKRFERAFLFGSYQPDCNPFSYLRGSLRTGWFCGHNYASSRHYIETRIQKLQQRERWSIWQYYILGKLTHYLADAFTYPHNPAFRDSLLNHHQYETSLRLFLLEYLPRHIPQPVSGGKSVIEEIAELHRQYLASSGDLQRDAWYILQATSLLMNCCQPTVSLG